jgi:hypothetical protein
LVRLAQLASANSPRGSAAARSCAGKRAPGRGRCCRAHSLDRNGLALAGIPARFPLQSGERSAVCNWCAPASGRQSLRWPMEIHGRGLPGCRFSGGNHQRRSGDCARRRWKRDAGRNYSHRWSRQRTDAHRRRAFVGRFWLRDLRSIGRLFRDLDRGQAAALTGVRCCVFEPAAVLSGQADASPKGFVAFISTSPRLPPPERLVQ